LEYGVDGRGAVPPRSAAPRRGWNGRSYRRSVQGCAALVQVGRQAFVESGTLHSLPPAFDVCRLTPADAS
jgi:hypothetical protein